MHPLRNVRQDEAVRAFCRMGGEERRGKGSHRVVNFRGRNLSIPRGVLKIGLLKRLLEIVDVTEQEFRDCL